MGLLRQIFKRALTTVLPSRRFRVAGPRASRQVALTFDDGPSPEVTPRVLDTLRELHVPATFFAIGQKAAAAPDLLRRVVADGHALGHHSYTHTEPSETDASQLLDEVRRCRLEFQAFVDRDCTLFRPPKGQLSPWKLARLVRTGLSVVLWNVDPRDYRSTRSELSRWLDSYKPQGGDIVLLHDIHPQCADFLPELIGHIRQAGLEFVTLADWNAPLPSDAAS